MRSRAKLTRRALGPPRRSCRSPADWDIRDSGQCRNRNTNREVVILSGRTTSATRQIRARAKIDMGLKPHGAHANVDAAPSIQSISISRFPADVDWRLYVEYRHMDADCRAGLAHLPFEPFGISAGAGSVSCGYPHLLVLADRRRRRRPDRAPQDFAHVAVGADGERGRVNDSGHLWAAACLAHLVSVLCVGAGAGVRWASLSGADSDAGRSRGYAECDCAEFHSIQPCSDGGSGAGGSDVGEVRREVVLWAECAFVPGSDYYAVNYFGAIFAGEHQGVALRQLEAGNSVRPAARIDGGADCAGLLHDRVEHADADLYSRFRERYFPSWSGDVWEPALAHGSRFDLWVAGSRGDWQHPQQGTLRTHDAHLPGSRYFG